MCSHLYFYKILDLIIKYVYNIVMYITEVKTKTKTGKVSHRCILLRESYRENGQVKNRTIANLTHCKPEEISAFKLALQQKDKLGELKSLDDIDFKQGLSFGAAWVVYQTIKNLGIAKALGNDRQAKLAIWQIMAHVILPGSRLAAVRLANIHAACDIIGIPDGFHEDHLYPNLAWLADHQRSIEKELFRRKWGNRQPDFFLYDVTSSFLEGQHHELGAYGYNRDLKKGKKQIVLGLLCDQEGEPVAIDVFRGNTADPLTMAEQVRKVAQDFNCQRVTFVGDRGMIKTRQINELKAVDFHYITAITKPQIEKLIKNNVFQLDLFEDTLGEVVVEDVRYILRRNPARAAEMQENRAERLSVVESFSLQQEAYLRQHPRSKRECALKRVQAKIKQLKLNGWLSVQDNSQNFLLIINEAALLEESALDGCYVIKSDLPDPIDKQTIHDRYKDLAYVEEGFRTCKTVLLEMRPWYVATAQSTRGLAFSVMLGYRVVRELKQKWATINLTVAECLESLSRICIQELSISGAPKINRLPTPCDDNQNLLDLAGVKLPKNVPSFKANVVSRKKLQHQRIFQKN